MYVVMQENRHAFDRFAYKSEEKFFRINENIGELTERVGTLEHTSREQDSNITFLVENKVSKEEFTSLKEELSEIKSSCMEALEECKEIQCSQRETIELQEAEIARLKLEQRRTNYKVTTTAERISAQEIRSKYLLVTIDGIPETNEKSTVNAVIDRIREDTGTEFIETDFESIYRVGQYRGGGEEGEATGRPRQIKVKLANDKARDKIMDCRGKLQPAVWVNEVHPDDYRRRKIMLRELVKYLNKKKDYRVVIEAGGIRVNGQFYEPAQFDSMPDDCHPRLVQMLDVQDGGIAFAGEWAYMSNMHRCPLHWSDLDFNSSEQALQFAKAEYHNCNWKAEKILLLDNPFDIKKIGESILDSDEWVKEREGIYEEIIREKFAQNYGILARLLQTGDRQIYEAKTSLFWGTNTGLHSKATRTLAGTGNNFAGKTLMKIRAEFAAKSDENKSLQVQVGESNVERQAVISEDPPAQVAPGEETETRKEESSNT